MKGNHWKSAETLLDLKFQRKQSIIVGLNSHEARLRAQINQITEHDKSTEQSSDQQMKSIGADVIWKAWVGRTKEKLNRELAQVLAQKETVLRDMRRDFGRVLVCRELIDLETKKIRKAKSKNLLSQTSSSSVIR